MSDAHQSLRVAIACGGTGGHLFPGIAVAEELRKRGGHASLLISAKDVHQQAVKDVHGMEILTLPAVGLSRFNLPGFAWRFSKSYFQARRSFLRNPPDCVLGMGGFTSAPPVLAARRAGATTFLHESNTIPGRANRLLARFVDGAFIYFEQTAALLNTPRIECVGMPVRRPFLEPIESDAARASLGLKTESPVLLVMGGSQGASGVNDLVLSSLPLLRAALPSLQFIHLTGTRDLEKVRAAYAAQNVPAVVRAFIPDTCRALAAADAAVSRAGASSLAELAARQLPSLLIPYPLAAADHQYFNAKAFVKSGAARMIDQQHATPELLSREIVELIGRTDSRDAMRRALGRWSGRDAAAAMAERILNWPAPGPLPPGDHVEPQKMEAVHA